MQTDIISTPVSNTAGAVGYKGSNTYNEHMNS
jgi:hypothetical protein